MKDLTSDFKFCLLSFLPPPPPPSLIPFAFLSLHSRIFLCLCAGVCMYVCVLGGGVQGMLYNVYFYIFRLMYISVGLTNFVKCHVLISVDEKPRYRNFQLQRNRGKLLLSKTTQENALQKNKRYWTNGQNTSLSFTITGPSVLICPQRDTEEDYPIHRKELEAAVQLLKTICKKDLETGEWPTPWTQLLVITLPKKGNLQQCQNYLMIRLISHPRKVMLKIILNRLKPHAEQSLRRTGRLQSIKEHHRADLQP